MAPLTIVIGKNGSGKSVLTRLPVLLAGSLHNEDGGPVDLAAGGLEHALSYQDLVYARGSLPFSLGAEVELDGRTTRFETTMRYVGESRSLAVERCEVSRDGTLMLRAEISSEDELAQEVARYRVELPGSVEDNYPLEFRGLLPRPASFQGTARDFMQGLLDEVMQGLPPPSYLGPFRAEPNLLSRSPNQGVRSLGPRGERAIELLADDKLRNRGRVGAAVSSWFTSTLGQGIAIDLTGMRPKLLVTDHATQIDIALQDTGVGFAQVLPIIVQNYAFRSGRLNSDLLLVEQPELHLHPAAHGNVADAMIASSSHHGHARGGATCVAETHSEQFIMRVRRRIAEGLAPESVIIWSVNHRDSPEDSEADPLRMITFDKEGNPSSWPAGVFDEALNELTYLRQAVRGL